MKLTADNKLKKLIVVGDRVLIRPAKESEKTDLFSIPVLFALALATSIDALIVGITFVFINIEIFWPAIIIGITTFALSLIGVFLGCRFSGKCDNKAGIFGGIILIGIGLKILIEHTL